MQQKLTLSVLLTIFSFILFTGPAAAVQFSSTNSNTWCGSTLQTAINSTDYTSLFGTQLGFISTENDCNARFSLISADDWETGKQYYYTANGSAYLPAGVTNAWTVSPSGANNVFVINSAGATTTSVPANSDAGYEALPTIYLTDDVCVASDAVAGNSAAPYTITNVGCNTAPTITITNSTNQLVASTSAGITISGTVTDPDSNQTITISATIGGATKSTTVPTAATDAPWTISWTFAELAAGTHTSIAFTANDSAATGTATYTGNIIVDKTGPDCTAAIWDPAVSPWKSTGGQAFSLTGGVTDAGGSNLNVGTGSCTTAATDGSTCNVLVSDNAGNTTNCTSPANRVDSSTPALSCAITEGTNPEYQYINGTTVYYNPNFTGDFTASNTVTPPPSGVTQVTYPQMTATGWTPAAATDVTSAPYSQNYAWTTAATTSPGSKTIVATYGNGLTNQCAIVVTADSTAPAGASLNYATQFINDVSNPQINLNLTPPTDSGSGIDASAKTIMRASAPLSGGVCGTYGSFAETTWTGTEPNILATEAITPATCYKYQAVGADNVGNTVTITSANEIKVDTQQPVVSVASITDTSPYLHFNSGTSTLYYKTPTTSTNFTVNVTAVDPVSGMASVTFPGITAPGFSPSANTTDTSSPYSATYTIDTTATTSPGTLTVTATNNAAATETTAFTVTADNGGPSGNSVTCPGAYSTDASFNILGNAGTDSGAGMDNTQSFIQVASAPLNGDVCGTFGAFGNTGSAMSTNLSQNPMAEGCYQYRYHSVDLVGNVTDSSTCTIKVDLTDPTCGAWSPADPVPWKGTAATQTFTLSSSTDAGSGMAAASYSCTAAATHNATCNVTIADNAGNTTLCTSPANRIDTGIPGLVVSAAESGWQTAPQDIVVTAPDTGSGIARIAYSWDSDTLGADCSGGTAISSGDNLKSTQPEGEHTLYVCAVSNAGQVATYTGTYRQSAPPSMPRLANQVPTGSLYWNVHSLSPEMGNLVIPGYFVATGASHTYDITFTMPSTGQTYTQTVNTSATADTNFEIQIPIADFNAGPTNASFIGPQVVTVKDMTSLLETTFDYNVSYYFPIYQTTTAVNPGYFIMASDSRTNTL